MMGGPTAGYAAGMDEITELKEKLKDREARLLLAWDAFQRVAGKVIDDGEAAEAAAGGELIVDEVHRPALVGSLRRRDGHTGHGRQLLAAFATQREAFLAIKALGAFVVEDEAFGAQHVVEDGSAPAWKAALPEFEKWPQNALRHTFGSHYYALTKSISETAYEMGNSEGVVRRHYVNAVEDDDCKRLWRLTPAIAESFANKSPVNGPISRE